MFGSAFSCTCVCRVYYVAARFHEENQNSSVEYLSSIIYGASISPHPFVDEVRKVHLNNLSFKLIVALP
jgi:hypothetical protein